jgi:hypothetical protein
MTVGELCDGRQAMWRWASYVAVSKLCGNWQGVYRWQVAVDKPWGQLADCIFGELYTVGKLCVGQLARAYLATPTTAIQKWRQRGRSGAAELSSHRRHTNCVCAKCNWRFWQVTNSCHSLGNVRKRPY